MYGLDGQDHVAGVAQSPTCLLEKLYVFTKHLRRNHRVVDPRLTRPLCREDPAEERPIRHTQ